jgi:hypothetical protein
VTRHPTARHPTARHPTARHPTTRATDDGHRHEFLLGGEEARNILPSLDPHLDAGPGPQPPREPVDMTLLALLLSAAWDRCAPCLERRQAKLAEDAGSTAGLIHATYREIQHSLGGLPRMLMDPFHPTSPASPEFRLLASVGIEGGVADLLATTEAMTPAQRRAAAATALDLLLTHLSGEAKGESL